MVIKRISVILMWLLIWLWASIVPLGAQLQVGQTLDSSNWQEAKGMMPDAILKRFETGQHLSEVIAVPPEGLMWGSRFLELTEANAGKYTIDAEGILIETATGSWPRYIDGGFPFPELDPDDSQAAYKIMYNMAPGLLHCLLDHHSVLVRVFQARRQNTSERRVFFNFTNGFYIQGTL